MNQRKGSSGRSILKRRRAEDEDVSVELQNTSAKAGVSYYTSAFNIRECPHTATLIPAEQTMVIKKSVRWEEDFRIVAQFYDDWIEATENNEEVVGNGGGEVEYIDDDDNDDDDNCRWRKQEEVLKRYSLVREQYWRVVAEFQLLRETLNDPATQLLLARTRDKMNWHPWDHNLRFETASLMCDTSILNQPSQIVRACLVNTLLSSSRLEHLLQVMVYHPQYLECFLKTQQFLMRGDGPLPYHYRHYIAIMAVARQRCRYLIDIHRSEFLLQGGDESWLEGLDYIPVKLRRLSEINKILAHRPWLITKEHIQDLVTGPDKWSLSELMQALVLLAHFHSLATFVYGCGVHYSATAPVNTSTTTTLIDTLDSFSSCRRTKIDSVIMCNSEEQLISDAPQVAEASLGIGSHSTMSSSGTSQVMSSTTVSPTESHDLTSTLSSSALTSPEIMSDDGADGDCGIDQLVQTMKRLNERRTSDTASSEDEMRENFEKVDTSITQLQPAAQAYNNGQTASRDDDDILRFVTDLDFNYQYVEHARPGINSRGGVGGGGRGGSYGSRSRGVMTFCTRNFSWEHEGYSLSCRLYMEVGVALDEKFRVAKNLTYYTMGNNRDVDTTPFRHAIWNYVHCLYRIRHEEYDYSVVNQLLDDKLKLFIQSVACYPRQIRRSTYDSFMNGFRHSEKVHVNLMLMEARLEAELLYSLHAVSRYMCTAM